MLYFRAYLFIAAGALAALLILALAAGWLWSLVALGRWAVWS